MGPDRQPVAPALAPASPEAGSVGAASPGGVAGTSEPDAGAAPESGSGLLEVSLAAAAPVGSGSGADASPDCVPVAWLPRLASGAVVVAEPSELADPVPSPV